MLFHRHGRACPYVMTKSLISSAATAGVTLVSVDPTQARIAVEARIRFSRDMGHGGALNFGDTFAYALVKMCAAATLYVGDDFTRTDIAAAAGASRR